LAAGSARCRWRKRQQHSAPEGVEAAKQELLKLGYSIIHDSPVAVDIPGFATPRLYDLVVQHPDSGYFVGVEVKTTLYDTIRLTADQVLKDAAVVAKGGTARVSGVKLEGVLYRTYCWDCERADLRSRVLKSLLDAAKIPYTHGKGPWQTRP
jgi:hypothetical protein